MLERVERWLGTTRELERDVELREVELRLERPTERELWLLRGTVTLRLEERLGERRAELCRLEERELERLGETLWERERERLALARELERWLEELEEIERPDRERWVSVASISGAVARKERARRRSVRIFFMVQRQLSYDGSSKPSAERVEKPEGPWEGGGGIGVDPAAIPEGFWSPDRPQEGTRVGELGTKEWIRKASSHGPDLFAVLTPRSAVGWP